MSGQTLVETLRASGMPLDVDEYGVLLRDLDPSGRGSVDARRFLENVRGIMSDTRTQLLRTAFQTLNPTLAGIVSLDTLRMKFNATRHPDVQSGKRTEEVVLREFMECCDIGRDGEVSFSDWYGFYNNISPLIEDDNYFQLMIWNTWNMGSAASRGGSVLSPVKEPMAAGYSSTAAREEHHLTGAGITTHLSSTTFGLPRARTAEAKEVSVADVAARIRSSLVRRGANSLVEMGRSFRQLERRRTGSVTLEDFSRACSMYGIKLSEQELNAIFGFYDRDRSGLIRVDDVMWGLRGDMPDRRRETVQRAFAKLDAGGIGSITIEDVALCYNPRENPDVVAGKITERQALKDFLDSFDSIDVDGRISLDEFLTYYASVSALVEDDSFFNLLLFSTWQLDKPNPRGPGARR